MNNTLANLLSGLTNAHIRYPLLGAIALELIPIWAPQWKAQCQETQKVLLMYGVIAAANSVPAATANAIQAVQAVAVAPTPENKAVAAAAVAELPGTDQKATKV